MSTAEGNSSSLDSPILSREQQELKELLQTFFTTEFPLAVARRCYEEEKDNEPPTPSEKQIWEKLSQLGLDEAFSGKDSLGFAELAIVAQEVGGCCLPAPLIEQLYFTKVLELEGLIAPPLISPQASSQTNKTKSPVTGYFKPRQSFAFGGDSTCLVVVLDGKANSLKIFKGEKASHNSLDRTQVLSVNAGKPLNPALKVNDVERHDRLYRLLKAGEALGAAANSVQMTRKYVLERKQFGVQIATFQAIQHKLADMYRYVEQMQSLYRFASWAASHSAVQEPLVSLSAIKFIYNHVVEVIEGAIQLHGGIGFTWEYDLHLLLRRAKMNQALICLDDADNKLLLKSSC